VAAGASAAVTTKASDDNSTKTLAAISLGVGILALILASAALLLRRRASKP
jgi:hypothetical protein